MRTLRGWAGAAHPFPLAMVLLLTALIALASTNLAPDAGSLSLLLMAMLTSQLAIGWSNDYVDRTADAIYQPAKPIPSGAVDSRLMPPAIALALGVSFAAGVALGLAPLLLLAMGTACGLVYNLWLKGTRLSPLPYVIAFTVLLVFVWTSLDVYRSDFLALYAVAVTLPVAAHIANVLPDLESDQAQSRRTLAVFLGRTRAVGVTMACQFAPLPLTALTLLWLDYEATILVPVLLVYAALSLTGGALYLRESSRSPSVWAFRCLVAGSVLFAAGWLAAV